MANGNDLLVLLEVSCSSKSEHLIMVTKHALERKPGLLVKKLRRISLPNPPATAFLSTTRNFKTVQGSIDAKTC